MALIAALSGSLAYSVANRRSHLPEDATVKETPAPGDLIHLVPGERNTMAVPASVVKGMAIHTAEVEAGPPQRPLVLSGSLALDPNRLISIHTRFPGEVMSIGVVPDQSPNEKVSAGEAHKVRPLQFGDRVTAGQLLAVIWCKEVGEKKSDLVDALSKLYADKVTLDRLNALPKGVVADQTVREAKRNFDADLIAVERSERTLRSWRVAEEELAEVRAEAKRIQEGVDAADRHIEKTWAEVEVRAPFAGVLMEKNIVVGNIIDTDLDLFKVADLSQLAVFAQVYEEDLPKIYSLLPEQRKWEIDIKSIPDDPRIPGRFDVIGKLVDPAQHTATIMGWVDNTDNHLYAGQFIKATIELPGDKHEVAVPASAVVEDAPATYVLVAADSSATKVTLRRVGITRHVGKLIALQGEPTEAQLKAGVQPIHQGERIVTSGVLELRSALQELKAAAKSKPGSGKLLDL